MIIGITGTDGGGKGTVVDYLVKEKGFVWCSARALWVDEIQKRGLEVNRVNTRIVANSLRAEHGNDFLIKEWQRRTGFLADQNYVIESIRATAEADALKEVGGVLWAVDAEQKVRYERVRSRASDLDKISFEKFVEQEALEMNDPDPSGMQKAKVMSMADVILTNNTTQEELFAQVEAALKASVVK